jgi:hypothetical protein
MLRKKDKIQIAPHSKFKFQQGLQKNQRKIFSNKVAANNKFNQRIQE